MSSTSFNEENFDEMVAESITDIHHNIRQKNQYKKFNKWFENNFTYLNDMYDLAEIYCEFEEFCMYVYNN